MLTNLVRYIAVLAIMTSACQCSASNTGFVGVNGDRFSLNGKAYHYGGTNCYYLMVYAADPSLRPYVDEILQDAADMGLTVVRTWAFNDGASQWNSLQTSPGVYQESVFQGLDYVLYKADQLGLRVILPFVNNWDDYGGMNQYVAWAGTTGHDNFYTNANCKTWYKNHISSVLNRVNTYSGRVYKNDPTVFAWELANEPRAQSKGLSIFNAWVQEMSAYIKAADPNHMVATGVEGFYASAGKNPRSWMNSTGTDFITSQQFATIDFAVAHSWPDHWGTTQSETMNLAQKQISDAKTTLTKPFVLEEFGKYRPDATRDIWYSAWMDLVFNAAAGGWNSWIVYHDAYTDYDGFGVYYPADSSTVAILREQAAKMGSLIPDENVITGTVSALTLSGTAWSIDRNVVIKATNASGVVLNTWTVPVYFVNDPAGRKTIGSFTITQVPDATAFLSAKTSWHTRQRQPVVFGADRSATAAFILPGGDINNNNVINAPDSTVLRTKWNTTDAGADINGDGIVQALDYSLMKMNWFEVGDPE